MRYGHIRKTTFIVCLLAVLGVIGISFAIQSPVNLLESSTNRMLSKLKSNKAQLRANPDLIEGFVRQIILPYIDVNSMVRQVLGREHYKKATSSQRSRFTKEFREMVIGSYSAAFSAYRNHSVRYVPLKVDYTTRRYIQVRSSIKQNGGRTIRVNYRLVKRGNNWRIYDFSVDGISMISSYRSQFSGMLAREGMDGLIKMVSKHNKG